MKTTNKNVSRFVKKNFMKREFDTLVFSTIIDAMHDGDEDKALDVFTDYVYYKYAKIEREIMEERYAKSRLR